MASWTLPNGLPRGILEGIFSLCMGRGASLFQLSKKLKGKSHVFDLQNGVFFSLMARDDDKMLFQGVKVMKHKRDTLESVILELRH